MNYRNFGATGLRISELGLGTCFMAEQGQENVNRCIHHAIANGVNYFDTAADYGRGNDERMLGIGLKEHRDRVILATKVGYTDDPADHRSVDGLMRQFEQSLARLQTDHVDIIQIHEADFRKWWSSEPITPEEGMDHLGNLLRDDVAYDFVNAPCIEFLRRAKASGKTRFAGITFKNARLGAGILEAVPEIDCMMVAHQFNPVLRNAAEFLFPVTERLGKGVVLGAALMKGWLAVPQRSWKNQRPEWMDDAFFDSYFRILAIAEQSSIPLAELSIRWMLGEVRQHCIVFGFSGLDVVDSNLQAASKGMLPPDVQSAVNAAGIVHPLLYQGRTSL